MKGKKKKDIELWKNETDCHLKLFNKDVCEKNEDEKSLVKTKRRAVN